MKTIYFSRNELATKWRVNPTTAVRTMEAHGFPGSKTSPTRGGRRIFSEADILKVERVMQTYVGSTK
jgi:hypothetical protein